MVNIGEMISEGDTKAVLAFGLILLIGSLQFIQGAIPEGLLALSATAVGYYFSKE